MERLGGPLRESLHDLEALAQPRRTTAGVVSQTAQRRVEAVEEALFASGRPAHAADEAVVVVVGARGGDEAHPLRPMAVDGQVRLLLERQPGHGVELAGVDPQVARLLVGIDDLAEVRRLAGLPVARDRVVELQRAPRREAGGVELRKTRRVRRSVERLVCDEADRLMVAVAVGLAPVPARDDDERLDQTDGADDLAHDGLASPAPEGVLAVLAEPVVVERAVDDLSAVEVSRLEALPRAHDAERVVLLRAAAVLAAFTPGGRPVHGTRPGAVGHRHQHAGVLVVGMRPELQHRADDRQRPEAIDQTSSGLRTRGSPCLGPAGVVPWYMGCGSPNGP